MNALIWWLLDASAIWVGFAIVLVSSPRHTVHGPSGEKMVVIPFWRAAHLCCAVASLALFLGLSI